MKALGLTLFFGGGLVMFFFELIWFMEWWGMAGLAVAIFLAPIAALFPFIFLVKEGFSLLYFGLWGASLAGAAIAGTQD